MFDEDKALRHRVAIRVSNKMKAWLDTVGSDAARGIWEAAMEGVSPAPLSTNVEAVAQVAEVASNKPVSEHVAKAPKRVKVSNKSTDEGVPRKSAIPVDLAAQVARIAAEKEARKNAREGLSDVGRLLSQFGK